MLWLLAGGALGTYLRYRVGRWFNTQPWGQVFPYGTLFINVTGSFVLAVVTVVFREWPPLRHEDWYRLLGTGFCGGYTTFSTFEWETFKLVRGGSWPLALTNILGSVVAGFLGVVVAVALASGLFPRG